jgi:tRNA pseudouridine38-40 synthase
MTKLNSNLEQLPFANYKMEIRYDGESYYGWQRHNEHPTIQAALEDAVTKCFGLRHNIEGSGRTDRGTHAEGQIATILLPENIDEEATLKSLNEVLDSSIEIINLEKVSDDFHARSSALGKCYKFKIWNHIDLPPERAGKVWYIPEQLDVKLMKDACHHFVGTLDFASFAKVPNFKRTTSVRAVYSFALTWEGPLLTFSIIGEGFLYKMVRNIVRAVVKVGEGRTVVNRIPQIIKAKNRNAAPGTAPASGLYLDTVFYDKDIMESAIEKNQEDEK